MNDKKSRRSGTNTIDEADINGYLNTKEEALYKKVIWELLNKDYTTQKQQPTKNKKASKNPSNKKKVAVSQVDMEMEKETKRRRLSSKINFDVLEKEIADGEEAARMLEDVGDDDEKESCGGDDGDYRDGFQQEDENNENIGYGDYHVYIEDERDEDEYECLDADDDGDY